MSDLISTLFALQVALPLVLILANALLPYLSSMGFALRVMAIALLLIHTALAGLWLFPPWWTPLALGVLHLLLSLWRFRRQEHIPVRGWLARAEFGTALFAIAAVARLLHPVLEGRQIPQVAMDLAQPLGPGRYLVVSGGTTRAINAHVATLDLPRAADFRGQSYAVDVIGLDAYGRRSTGILPVDPSAYVIQGVPVSAPCAGRVIGLTDGVPDNPVPQMNRDVMTGNSVILDCEGLAVVLAHFRPGSLRVALGDEVAVGQHLAEVGNSGNSGEPHLHLHVQTRADDNRPLSGTPLHFTVEGAYLRRNDRFVVD